MIYTWQPFYLIRIFLVRMDRFFRKVVCELAGFSRLENADLVTRKLCSVIVDNIFV